MGGLCVIIGSQPTLLLFIVDHGGPLVNGDIEELGGKVTIKCPWHAYHIAVATGEGLYKGMEMVMGPSGKFEPVPGAVKSKGVKQRTHFVEIRNGNEIFVADSSKIPGEHFDQCDRRMASL